MEKESKQSGYFNAITALIAIISMVTTCNLTNRQISQSEQHFKTIALKDSLLNIEQQKVIDQQLLLVERQNDLLNSQNDIMLSGYRVDSLLQRRRIEVAQQNILIQKQEKKNREALSLNEFNDLMLEFIFDINIPQHSIVKITDDQLAEWFQKVNSLMQKGLSNEVLLRDKKSLQKWREIMESNRRNIPLLTRSTFRNRSEEEKEVRKKEMWDFTSKGLKQIYNTINKSMGYDKLIGVG